MERPDLYQDDLTEERYPSPARRDDVAGEKTLDPDASADDGNAKVMPSQQDVQGKTALGYPHGVPGGVHGDPEIGDEDDDEDDEDDDDAQEDELDD